jgi:hypothetical protein
LTALSYDLKGILRLYDGSRAAVWQPSGGRPDRRRYRDGRILRARPSQDFVDAAGLRVRFILPGGQLHVLARQVLS